MKSPTFVSPHADVDATTTGAESQTTGATTQAAGATTQPAGATTQAAGATTQPGFSDRLIGVTQPQAQPFLKDITHIYTDLDGTLFAPGGKLLTTHDGTPSTAVAEALVDLKRAGIEIIIVTGRNGIQGNELLRLLDLQTFIGEVGCMIQEGFGFTSTVSYELGDWAEFVLADGLAPGELPDGLTPYRLILNSGVIERLEAAFPGKLELHNPYPDERKVTHSFRGFVDLDKVEQVLAGESLPLALIDNGQIHPQQHTLVDVPEVHIYHLVPRGTSKAAAVAIDISRRGLKPAQTLAIGDAIGDLEMGEHTGTVVMTGNALRSPTVREGLDERTARGETTLFTEGFTADGWVEFAQALLAARGGVQSGV